jgi:hypothetical protein
LTLVPSTGIVASMPVYLVAYDIMARPQYDRRPVTPAEETNANKRREEFRKSLFAVDRAAHKLSESAYMIESGQTVEAITEALRPSVAQWDEFYVTALTEPLHGQGELREPETTKTLRAWLAGRSL